jgi:hypothetical protein
MRPAFSSTKQAAAFTVMVLVILLLPLLMVKPLLPPREQIYSSIWWANGAYPYLDQQIFQEKGEIDIAFIGASHIWQGIDTPYVQQQLSAKLGRQAVVRTFGWGGSGYDALYFITQDLLEHRKVRTLVYYDVYDEEDIPQIPHVLAPHWFRFGDNAGALSGLSRTVQSSYYFAAVLGMPRNLLCSVSPNLPADLFSLNTNCWVIKQHAINPAARLGALTEQLGFAAQLPDHVQFEEYSPQTQVQPSDVCIYSPESKSRFEFEGAPLPPAQSHFARKFAELARAHGCRLILLHVPVLSERKSTVVRERLIWPDALQADIQIVGIPAATLFSNLTENDVLKLYCDKAHFNQNGQAYFTRLITPDLLNLYAAKN